MTTINDITLSKKQKLFFANFALSNHFLQKYAPYIIVKNDMKKEDVVLEENQICLNQRSDVSLVIDKSYLPMIDDLIIVHQEYLKEKTRVKAEKKAKTLIQLRKKYYEKIVNELTIDNFDSTLLFLSKKYLHKNKTFILEAIKADLNRKSFSFDNIESYQAKIQMFFDTIKELNEFEESMTNHARLQEVYPDFSFRSFNKISFKNKFFKKYCSKEEIFSIIDYKNFRLYDQNISIKLSIDYDDKCLSKIKTNDDLKAIKPMYNGELENIVIPSDYCEKIFNKITKSFVVLQNDKMLYNSLLQDFITKSTSDLSSTINVKLKFNGKISKNKIVSIIYDKVIELIFKMSKRREAGFKKSIERKIINSNIKIDSVKNLFLDARNRNRELYFFYGETNSGKTYNAFEFAKKFNSGIYAAPLRLLALEGQQEFEKRGIPCSMVTGEEQEYIYNAKFISSTVEMTDFSAPYDVAIIDEVQMLNDKDRGHSWFEAILGVNAKKVILVGSEDILSVIKSIADYLNEPLHCEKFERKTKLEFNKNLFQDVMKKNGKLPKNSAVITFSKRKVLKLKERFEKLGNSVSVIYGALPPKVRRYETEKFVSGKSDIVIATDAIGMGLNLPIENLFFHEKEKFNGVKIENLEVGLIKQIAGRSGRYNKFDVGYVSALTPDVFDFINDSFKHSSEISNVVLSCSANYQIINQLQSITNEKSIFKLLQTYKNSITFDFGIKHYLNEMNYSIAKRLDKYSEQFGNSTYDVVSLRELVKLVHAPISDNSNNLYLFYFFDCVRTLFKLKSDTSLPSYDFVYEHLDSIKYNNQEAVENAIKKIDILSWLAFNFEEYSVLKEDIEDLRYKLNNKLIKFLN